jgi:hypothetical protein
MRANELSCKDLMVGDYVRHKKTKDIIRIFEIDNDRAVINNEADGYCSERNISINDIEPIPLTLDVLEKLGFSNEGSTACVHAKCYTLSTENYKLTIADYSKYKRLLLNVDSVDAECFNIKCNYLHELQHALRLCGIEKEIEL